MSDFEDFLAHYGVKGQKWGVRRASRGTSSGSSIVKPHADALMAKEAKTKVKKGSVDALSNTELQSLVSRMNLEKQYKTLAPPSSKQRAGKFLAETLANVGKQQASKAVNDQVSKRIAKIIASAGK